MDLVTLKSAKNYTNTKTLPLFSDVTITNKLSNSNFASATNWSFVLSNGSVSNNEAIFTATALYGQLRQGVAENVVVGKKYYFRAKVKSSSSNVNLSMAWTSDGSIITEVAHSGNGQYAILEGTFIATASAAIQFKIIDYNSANFAEIRVAEVMLTSLTVEYGAGYESSVSDYKSVIQLYNNQSLFVQTTLAVKAVITRSTLPLFVNITNNILNVIAKYNATQDLRFVLNKKGPNSIFDFGSIYKVTNNANSVSNNISAGTSCWSNGTDSFGPFTVAAVSNADGDNPGTSAFTGGNHGYNGDATGSATGRTSSISFFVDGRKVTSFSGFASFVEIEWINYIQAYNTKKASGGGREVIKKTYRMSFDGLNWEVRNIIEFLEACNVETYYGLQLSCTSWNGYLLFHSATNKQWNAGNVNCNSGSKTCNLVTHKLNTDFADLGLDISFGLANSVNLHTAAYNAFRTNYDKSYFNLIDYQSGFSAGDVLSLRGYYKFYSA